MPLRLALLPLTGLLVAACSGGSASPSPVPTPPAGAAYLLRVTSVQALPPPATFNWLPSVLITLDGKVLVGGAVPAIFPGPLVMPITERGVTAAGWARIVDAARTAGLLSGARDFTGGAMAPGSMATRLEIVAGGQRHDLVGDASRVMNCITTPCEPQPGTPEAFAGFILKLSDLAWLRQDIGAEQRYVPSGYGILVGPAPDDQGLPQPPIVWPLEGGFAAFGKALADGSGGRCGTVTGEQATSIRGALTAATQITKWRDPVDGSFHGLVVRPLLPGDGDLCEGLV